jgi:hypothetical protein
MLEQEHQHKYRKQDGETPSIKAYHEVHITKDLGSTKNDDVTAYITEHIGAAKGHTEDKHGIPVMLFDRSQDAMKFARELGEKFNISMEHIAIKAQKFTR